MVFCESGSDLALTRTLFLRICALCYAMAFLSLYPQIPGLYGPQGLLPIHGFFADNDSFDWTQSSEVLQRLQSRPTLLWFARGLGLTPDLMLDLLCLLGTILGLSAAFKPSMNRKVTFVILWIFYQSIYQVGQTFMWFQWDILLLEIGFLCIIVAPFHGSTYYVPRPYDHLNMMLVRWLLFRMMFASGVVKLTSQCPTWWGLTALPTHYESQCIPTPLAWFAYQLPEFFHKLSVAGTFFIEIGLVFLFFAPTENLRKLTFVHQVLLMIVIMLTGNYNFFNLLFIGLCVSLMDDSWFSRKIGMENYGFTSKIPKMVNLAGCMGIAYLWYILALDIKTDQQSGSLTLDLNLKFTKTDFNRFMTEFTFLGVVLGGLSLAFSALLTLYKGLNPPDVYNRNSGFFRKMIHMIWSGIYICIAASMFLVSTPIFTRGVGQPTPPYLTEKLQLLPSAFVEQAQNLHLVSSYGLFRRMTGVGGRPEVVIEVANKRNGPWKELHFRYKPGNLTEAPQFVLPHQPRLDWQMWFAALGDYQHNPWFLSLLYRILESKCSVYLTNSKS